jgi:hypothetical protein
MLFISTILAALPLTLLVVFLFFFALPSLWRFIPRPIRNLFVKRQASYDAHAGTSGEQEVIGRWLDLQPRFDPLGNRTHQRKEAELTLPAELPAWEKQLDKVETELTQHLNRTLLWVALIACFIIDWFGDAQCLALINVDQSRRPIIATAFAIVLFALTWMMARHDELHTNEHRRLRWTTIGLGIYSVIVLGIAIITVTGTPADDDTTLVTRIASAILIIAACCGPAWLGKLLMNLMGPVEELSKNANRLQRKITRAKDTQQRARRYVDRIQAKRHTWDIEATQIAAVYRIEHRRRFVALHPEVRTHFVAQLAAHYTGQPLTAQPPKLPTPTAVFNPYQRPGNGKDQP